jgi:hypothetical protein
MPRVTLRDGRAGEGVGMPIRRKTLHAPEGIARGDRHHAQREAHDEQDGARAQHQHGKAERDDGAERPDRCVERCVAVGGAVGDGVDQSAGVDRQQNVGERRGDHGASSAEQQPALAPPLAEDEDKHGTERIRAPADRFLVRSHE